MSKFVRLSEGSFYLNTTTSNIMVTAFNHKKKFGEYPHWYKSDGNRGAKKSYIDIDHILDLREKELKRHHESCDLFYFITEEMNIKQSHLAPILASNSEIYNKRLSWMSFMQTTLFSKPIARFDNRVTRLQEFHRIVSKLKEDFLCKKET